MLPQTIIIQMMKTLEILTDLACWKVFIIKICRFLKISVKYQYKE